MKTQLELQQEIIKSSGINIVTCGDCGSVVLHEIEVNLDKIECPDCGLISDPCDFPDLNY
jgi:uncharacterized Zn finger protein